MPDIIADPPLFLYVLFGVFALVCVSAFFAKPDKKRIVLLALAFDPLLFLFIFDFVFESPREHIKGRIESIASATRTRQLEPIFQHFSKDVKHGNYDRAGLEAKAREGFQRFQWPGATVWDITRADFEKVSDTKARQGFMVRLSDSPTVLVYCVAGFQKQGNSPNWLCDEFKFYNPLQRTNGPEEKIPGL